MILEGKKDTVLDKELASLMEVERQARQNNELELSLKTNIEIVDLLWKSKDLELLAKTAQTLCNKRGQPIKSVTNVVQKCIGFINQIADERKRIAFVETMKAITEKKIYLEVEYAKCCMILVKYNEDNQNNLEEAAKIMENVQVETYGSMDKKEKLEFILYQIKLNVLLNDFNKIYIVSRKVNPKHLEDDGLETIKISYFLYQFYYHNQMGEYSLCTSSLERVFEALSKVDRKVFDSEVDKLINEKFSVLLDKNALAEVLMTFKCLEKFKVSKFEELEAMAKKYEIFYLESGYLINLIKLFTSRELTSCDPSKIMNDKFTAFNKSFQKSEVLLINLERQMIKKNLYLMSLYYRKIKMEKLSVLLENKVDLIEDMLCEMILEGLIKAKIDRLARIIEIKSASDEREVVDQWVTNINEIVDLVDFVSERIEREQIAN